MAQTPEGSIQPKGPIFGDAWQGYIAAVENAEEAAMSARLGRHAPSEPMIPEDVADAAEAASVYSLNISPATD